MLSNRPMKLPSLDRSVRDSTLYPALATATICASRKHLTFLPPTKACRIIQLGTSRRWWLWCWCWRWGWCTLVDDLGPYPGPCMSLVLSILNYSVLYPSIKGDIDMSLVEVTRIDGRPVALCASGRGEQWQQWSRARLSCNESPRLSPPASSLAGVVENIEMHAADAREQPLTVCVFLPPHACRIVAVAKRSSFPPPNPAGCVSFLAASGPLARQHLQLYSHMRARRSGRRYGTGFTGTLLRTFPHAGPGRRKWQNGKES